MTRASANTPGWLPGLSIRSQLVGAIGLILISLAGASLISVYAFDSVADSRRLSDRVNTTLVRATDLDSAISRQKGALLSYALTGEPRFGQAVTRDEARIAGLLERLNELTAGMPDRQRALEQISALQTRWDVDVAEPLMQRMAAGNDIDRAVRLMVARQSTALLDPIKEMLDNFRRTAEVQLARSSQSLAASQQRALWSILAVLGLGLLIGAIAVVAIVRRVTSPLTQLARTTKRLARGDLDVDVGFRDRADEIGAVARALESSRRASLKQDKQNWIRTQRAELSELIQACDSEQELGDRLLGELAPLLGAPHAVLFTPDSDPDKAGVDLQASYGYTHREHVPTHFAEGEGLVGQVLRERKPIVISPAPDDYVRIASGLGEAAPTTLIITPALFKRRVVAILEIALFQPLRPQDEELLDSLLPTIAVALLTLSSARRTEELLERSRAQTLTLRESEQTMRDQKNQLSESNEELRTKSEELRSQAEQLRASEEELKVQAEELQTSNEELRQKQELMETQTAQLSRLNDEVRERARALAQASQYKSDFLANMSHELRTPLNSLLILSRSLADNDQGNLDGEQVEAATIIHESGNSLLGLINDILDLSKIEAGKMQVNPEQASVAALAQRLERHFSHVAERKRLGFVVHVADDAPASIVTDAARLDQVINNLVSNALKFTEHGDVRVEFAVPANDVRFADSTLTPATALAIHVSDNGIGISDDRIEQIFEAFEQVDAGITRAYGGTGLGLSITRQLTQLLGGEVAVRSTEGEGSTFSVYVARQLTPAAASESAPASARPGVAAGPRQAPVAASAVADGVRGTSHAAPHLLIIDDDERFAQVVAQAARKHGFESTIAANGEAGLAEAQRLRPTAIVLDLGLPGMDGWAVLDRLKADPLTKQIPVHIVSAADDTGRYKQTGAVGFLTKPIERRDLDTIFARVDVLSGPRPRRLLVVDDDRDAHKAIAQLLKNEMAEIVAVETGAGALEALDGQPFDCVVLDLRLPDISGFDLLEQIATREEAPPVVVYSARDLSADETRRLRVHADSIVVKGARAQERLLDEVSLFFHHIGDAVPQPQPPAADTDLTDKTVLLVDDDMRNTFALSRVLRGRGLKVLMASDGAKALAQLDSHRSIQLVLMDIMMPGMDGFEAMRRIRAQPQFAELPIIALTAKAMAGDRETCLEAGADDYLPKPLDTDILVDRIKALI